MTTCSAFFGLVAFLLPIFRLFMLRLLVHYNAFIFLDERRKLSSFFPFVVTVDTLETSS